MSSLEENNLLFRNKITYLSFCLSILVILIHTVNLKVYNVESGTLYFVEKIINSIADYAVPTFFMLSGYQFYRDLSKTTIKRKLKSRFYMIVIPLLLWGGIEYLFFATLKSTPFIGVQLNSTGNPFDIRVLADMIILGGSHLWFLRNLILYHLVAFGFFGILNKKWLFPCIIVFFICVPILIPTLDTPKGILKNMPYYLFGAGLSCHYRSWFESCMNKKWGIVSGMVAAMLAIFLVFIQSPSTSIIVRLLGSLLIWVFASALPIEKKANGFITQSFFIYVAHVMILECVEKIILILFKNTLTGAWIDFFISPLITLGILFIIFKICYRYDKLWSILTGSRI